MSWANRQVYIKKAREPTSSSPMIQRDRIDQIGERGPYRTRRPRFAAFAGLDRRVRVELAAKLDSLGPRALELGRRLEMPL